MELGKWRLPTMSNTAGIGTASHLLLHSWAGRREVHSGIICYIDALPFGRAFRSRRLAFGPGPASDRQHILQEEFSSSVLQRQGSWHRLQQPALAHAQAASHMQNGSSEDSAGLQKRLCGPAGASETKCMAGVQARLHAAASTHAQAHVASTS